MSAADGNKNGVGIVSTESNFNKIYVAPTIRGVSEATEITVRVKDKYGYSKTITVNIGEVAAPTYSATVDPVDFGTVRVGYSPVTQVPLRVFNTGTGKINCNLNSITLEGENASSFTLNYYANPYSVGAGMENTKSWSVKPNSGLAVGTYVATIKFSGTPEYSKYGGSSVEATATVKFVVTEHDFDTSMWEYDTTKHWNPCKDTGCAVHGNEAAHDTEGELKMSPQPLLTRTDTPATNTARCAALWRKRHGDPRRQVHQSEPGNHDSSRNHRPVDGKRPCLYIA